MRVTRTQFFLASMLYDAPAKPLRIVGDMADAAYAQSPVCDWDSLLVWTALNA